MPGKSGRTDDDAMEEVRRRRLRGFAVHLAAYFVIVTGLVVYNYTIGDHQPWVVLPMVGWGSVLAVHVAWVMGLFDGLFGGG